MKHSFTVALLTIWFKIFLPGVAQIFSLYQKSLEARMISISCSTAITGVSSQLSKYSFCRLSPCLTFLANKPASIDVNACRRANHMDVQSITPATHLSIQLPSKATTSHGPAPTLSSHPEPKQTRKSTLIDWSAVASRWPIADQPSSCHLCPPSLWRWIYLLRLSPTFSSQFFGSRVLLRSMLFSQNGRYHQLFPFNSPLGFTVGSSALFVCGTGDILVFISLFPDVHLRLFTLRAQVRQPYLNQHILQNVVSGVYI